MMLFGATKPKGWSRTLSRVMLDAFMVGAGTLIYAFCSGNRWTTGPSTEVVQLMIAMVAA